MKTSATKHSIFRAVKKMRNALEPFVERDLRPARMIMNTHLSEDELILHYYGETARADEARVESHSRRARNASPPDSTRA